MKGPVNFDNSKHEVALKLLDLDNPRASTRLHGVGEILELENTFAKTLSQTWGTESWYGWCAYQFYSKKKLDFPIYPARSSAIMH